MRRSILVIDDEKVIRSSVMRYLERDGYDVAGAASASEALGKLHRQPFALGVCDLHLGTSTGDGLSVIAFARQHFPATRWVILTAHGSRENEDQAQQLGVEAFLRKPIPLAELSQILAGLLLLANEGRR